jgi:hypothetical protein
LLEEESQFEEDKETVPNSLWLQYSMLWNVTQVLYFGDQNNEYTEPIKSRAFLNKLSRYQLFKTVRSPHKQYKHSVSGKHMDLQHSNTKTSENWSWSVIPCGLVMCTEVSEDSAMYILIADITRSNSACTIWSHGYRQQTVTCRWHARYTSFIHCTPLLIHISNS